MPQAGSAPERPTVLELATWTWVAVTVLFWLAALVVLVGEPGGVGILNILFFVAHVALVGFGCWKFRSGSNGWRVFFTIISACYVIAVPFGLVDPGSSLAQKAFSVVIGTLAVAGLICAWWPDTNRYFREIANYRSAVKAQKYAEFMRNNPQPWR